MADSADWLEHAVVPGRELAAALDLDTRVLRAGNLELWPLEHQVFAAGERVCLTHREAQVLHILMLCPGHVVSKDRIYEHVWRDKPKHGRDRSVDVYIRHVRVKLADAAPSWTYIHTHFGMGFRLEPERRRTHPPGV